MTVMTGLMSEKWLGTTFLYRLLLSFASLYSYAVLQSYLILLPITIFFSLNFSLAHHQRNVKYDSDVRDRLLLLQI